MRVRGAAAASSGALAALAALSLPALVLGLSAGCRRAKLPPRPDGAAVVVVTPTGEAEVPAVSEVEPNDQPAKAHTLLVAMAPVAVTATLGVTGGRADVDLFRIDVPAGDAGSGPALPIEAGAAAAGAVAAGSPRPTRGPSGRPVSRGSSCAPTPPSPRASTSSTARGTS